MRDTTAISGPGDEQVTSRPSGAVCAAAALKAFESRRESHKARVRRDQFSDPVNLIGQTAPDDVATPGEECFKSRMANGYLRKWSASPGVRRENTGRTEGLAWRPLYQPLKRGQMKGHRARCWKRTITNADQVRATRRISLAFRRAVTQRIVIVWNCAAHELAARIFRCHSCPVRCGRSSQRETPSNTHQFRFGHTSRVSCRAGDGFRHRYSPLPESTTSRFLLPVPCFFP